MSRAFLEKEKIRFRPEIRSADDYYFLMKIMAKGKAVVIPKPLYRYRSHSTSISLERSEEQKNNELKISQLAFEEILNLKLEDAEAELFYRFYRDDSLKNESKSIAKLITLMKQTPGLSNDEKEKLIDFLVEKKHRFEREKSPFHSLFYRVKKVVFK